MQPPSSERRSRTGSATRKKGRTLTFRMDDAEHAALEAAAARDGLTLGTYVRTRILAEPTTRARRRATVDVVALARVQGELNRIGGNVYQLLRHVNFGGLPEAGEARAAFAGYREAIAALMEALGRTPR